MVLPKKIWFLWFQGLTNAPFIVKKCYQSWVELNPDWEVIFLDETNLRNYIEPALSEQKLQQLSKNHQSDLYRLQLLSNFGGVWVDSTTLCMIPINHWLYDYMDGGLFVFIHETRSYGWISNWFIAAEQSHPITTKLNQKLTAFFRDNSFYHEGRIQQKRVKFLSRFLNRKFKTTRFWSSWLLIKTFKVYPYLIFHFMFAKLIGSDRECLKLYKKMPNFYTTGDILGQYGLLNPLTEEIKTRIDSKIDPVYKLSWKYDEKKYSDSSVLYYLLEEAKSE